MKGPMAALLSSLQCFFTISATSWPKGFDVDLAGAATEVLGDALAGGVVGSCGLEEFVDEEREDERRVDIPVRLEAVEVSAEIRVEPPGT